MADGLLIRDVTLIDGTGAPPRAAVDIAIEAGLIRAIGAGIPEDAEVLDGRGLWAVPGLIDAHIHLELVGREALPVFLALGVTTVRDTGGRLDYLTETRRLLEGGAPGPRLLFAGAMIDGAQPTWPGLPSTTADAEAAARLAEEQLVAGADAIKLYTTLPPESVRRCIQQVDGRVPVTGHLGATLASTAMEAGINGLEHALLTPYNDLAPEDARTLPGEVMATPGFWGKVMQGWRRADLDSDRARRWIELLVARDVSFCPTLTVAPGAGDEPDADGLRRLPLVAERWRASQEERAGRSAFRDIALGARGKLFELVGRVHRAGGRIVAGTDAGAIPSAVPGYGLHRELGFLSQSGLSNMEVLHASTARAAEALRRPQLGMIEPGKRADLLLLRGDPLADLGALREIHRVVHDGVVYDPAALLGA